MALRVSWRVFSLLRQQQQQQKRRFCLYLSSIRRLPAGAARSLHSSKSIDPVPNRVFFFFTAFRSQVLYVPRQKQETKGLVGYLGLN